MLKTGAPQLLEKMTQPAEDYRRAGKIYATAGKKGAAMKAFATCEKLSSGHVASAMEACQLLGFDKKLVARLLSTVDSAGPVILYNGQFLFQPLNLPEADAQREEDSAVLRAPRRGGPLRAHAGRQGAQVHSPVLPRR